MLCGSIIDSDPTQSNQAYNPYGVGQDLGPDLSRKEEILTYPLTRHCKCNAIIQDLLPNSLTISSKSQIRGASGKGLTKADFHHLSSIVHITNEDYKSEKATLN